MKYTYVFENNAEACFDLTEDQFDKFARLKGGGKIYRTELKNS